MKDTEYLLKYLEEQIETYRKKQEIFREEYDKNFAIYMQLGRIYSDELQKKIDNVYIED